MSVINIDIDGVLARNVVLFCEYMDDKFNYSMNPNEITVYDQYIEEIDMSLEDIVSHIYDNNPEYLLNCETINNSVRSLSEISKNNTVNIITHREKSARDITEKWLSDNGFDYEKLYIGKNLDKNSIIGDVMIDDAPHIINSFNGNSTNIIIFPRYYNMVVLENSEYPQNPIPNSNGKKINKIIKNEEQWDYIMDVLEEYYI